MEISRDPAVKWKRIHLSTDDCYVLSNSEEGSKSITKPFLYEKRVKPYDLQHNLKNLHPRPLRKMKKNIKPTGYYDSQGYDHKPLRMCSQPQFGFVPASSVYSPTEECEMKCDTNLPVNSPQKIDSQKSILKFMTMRKTSTELVPSIASCTTSTSKPTTTCSYVPNSDHKHLDNLFENKRRLQVSGSPEKMTSKMFSPIKKLTPDSNTIYITDSSPTSSEKSSQESVSSENSAVRKLFDAQKNIFSGKSLKKQKVRKLHKKSNIKNNESILNSKFGFNVLSDKSCSSYGADNSDMEIEQKPVEVSDKYGLLCTGSSSELLKKEFVKINYFERLPLEVLENIFCMLPMLDLCLNSNRVCISWNEQISNHKFVPWKKLYHKLKKNVGDSRVHLRKIMGANGMDIPAKFLLGLIKYMRNFKLVTPDNLSECLQKHSKYSWAKALIEERIRDCIKNGEPNAWSVITTLVIVSDHVQNIQEIITCLSVSSSQCTALEMLECLYCIATFLYAFKLVKNNDVWNGMHYRLFYALYLFENTSTSSCSDLQSAVTNTSGQQTILKYSHGDSSLRLTHEQLRIVNHKPNKGDVVKVVAFAGTGKTTTLMRYTQLHPNMKFLLVVYNKSVCDHARTKFPWNVTCKTGHALAFGHVGRRYKFNNKLRTSNIKVYDLTQILRLVKGENLYIRAKFVLDTLNNYMASSDVDVTTAHVPLEQIDDNGQKKAIKHSSRMLYAEDAEYVWKRMIDLKDMAVPISHDGYLKVYQLSRPKLTEYDCILIDEAQDMTPALTDILLSQDQAKVLVGDPHQQIYSFRGAVNAMQQVTATDIFYLTQSFRFGPEISQVAAFCLETLKSEKAKTLVGSSHSGEILGEQKGQLAIITRCNFTLFAEAVKKCCFSDEPIKIAFVGGTEGFGFSMLQDIYTLLMSEDDRKKDSRCINNKFIKMFRTIADLVNYAKKTMDVELQGKIRIVQTYHHNLPCHINKILSKTIRDTSQADILFSTAHKAKGLEFSTVRLTDDYTVPEIFLAQMRQLIPNFEIHSRESADDESNLLYVAATRAKRALQMSPTLLSVLSMAGEQFVYPVLSTELKNKGISLKCKETDAEFNPVALTLQKQTITLGDGQVKHGGLFGPDIIKEDGGSFAQLLGTLKKESGDG